MGAFLKTSPKAPMNIELARYTTRAILVMTSVIVLSTCSGGTATLNQTEHSVSTKTATPNLDLPLAVDQGILILSSSIWT